MKESDKGGITLNRRDVWTRENAEAIARLLGYVPDERFALAVDQFARTTVETARFTQFLGVLAHGFFKKFEPPLQRSSNGHSPVKK